MKKTDNQTSGVYKPRQTIKTITPMMAQAIINKSKELGFKNRNVSERLVNRYARAMENGQWFINGEGIAIDTDGRLVNGQHRLLACIKAKMPFITTVCEGVDPKAFATYDSGRSRDASQVLAIDGVPYYNAVSSIIRGVAAIRSASHIATKALDISNQDVVAEYNANKDVYDRITLAIGPLCQKTHAMTPKLAGSVFFYLVHDLKQPWDLVEKFVTNSLSFDTSDNPYMDALRNWNLQHITTKVSERTRYGFVVLAWNGMVTGKKLTRNFFREASILNMPKFLPME